MSAVDFWTVTFADGTTRNARVVTPDGHDVTRFVKSLTVDVDPRSPYVEVVLRVRAQSERPAPNLSRIMAEIAADAIATDDGGAA